MCGGGGPSAESIYEGIKPVASPLPSLSMSSKDIIKRDGPSYGGVRTGSKRRSLLGPLLQANKDA
jgi:hypothetical protein